MKVEKIMQVEDYWTLDSDGLPFSCLEDFESMIEKFMMFEKEAERNFNSLARRLKLIINSIAFYSQSSKKKKRKKI